MVQCVEEKYVVAMDAYNPAEAWSCVQGGSLGTQVNHLGTIGPGTLDDTTVGLADKKTMARATHILLTLGKQQKIFRFDLICCQ